MALPGRSSPEQLWKEPRARLLHLCQAFPAYYPGQACHVYITLHGQSTALYEDWQALAGRTTVAVEPDGQSQNWTVTV